MALIFYLISSYRNKFAMKNNKKITLTKVAFLALFIILFMVSCNSGENSDPVTVNEASENTSPTPNANANQTQSGTNSSYPGALTESGYPEETLAGSADNGYPGAGIQENTFPEPPNPDRNIPVPSEDFGSAGGVLIREISDAGFLPVTPQALYLGDILVDSQGRQALIAQGEDSPKAQLFQTGVFIFDNIQPGTYGLVIDIGMSQFPINGEDGQPLLIDIEAGKVLDLGQVIVKLPG